MLYFQKYRFNEFLIPLLFSRTWQIFANLTELLTKKVVCFWIWYFNSYGENGEIHQRHETSSFERWTWNFKRCYYTKQLVKSWNKLLSVIIISVTLYQNSKVRRYFPFHAFCIIVFLPRKFLTPRSYLNALYIYWNLGPFPGATIMKIDSKNYSQVPQEIDLAVDIDYSGGFVLSLDVDLIFGRTASLSIKLNKLVGRVRLQYTRNPCTHWSFSFYEVSFFII